MMMTSCQCVELFAAVGAVASACVGWPAGVLLSSAGAAMSCAAMASTVFQSAEKPLLEPCEVPDESPRTPPAPPGPPPAPPAVGVEGILRVECDLVELDIEFLRQSLHVVMLRLLDPFVEQAQLALPVDA